MNLALGLAQEFAAEAPAAALVGWLTDVIRSVEAPAAAPIVAPQDVVFGPGPDCTDRVIGALRGAGRRIDICVFTITDDRISREILGAHRRGLRVRIISDDEKSQDLGADVESLAGAGIPTVYDQAGHMHHKFAVVDGRRLLNGSFNWTRGAAAENHENLVISEDERLVGAFSAEFERLWQRFGGR